jgi:hypothetical protein
MAFAKVERISLECPWCHCAMHVLPSRYRARQKVAARTGRPFRIFCSPSCSASFVGRERSRRLRDAASREGRAEPSTHSTVI